LNPAAVPGRVENVKRAKAKSILVTMLAGIGLVLLIVVRIALVSDDPILPKAAPPAKHHQ
jgi:hypothetical protein